MRKFVLASAVPFLVFAGGQSNQAQNVCPSTQVVAKSFANIFPLPNLKVLEVKKTPIKGLCEAVIQLNREKLPLYIDSSGRYLILGSRNGLSQIIDLKTKKNLTQEEIQELNKLSQEEVKALDKYVAFTYGKKGKVVYLFTDPECPFCQRLEPTLKKLADEGKIQIKVILFPLPFHPHAKEKAVAIVCHHIGWKGLRGSYWTDEKMKNLSKWQCKEGQKLVEESIKIGQKYGVSGTPTMITKEGKKVVGALPEPMLKKELGIK